MRVIGVDPGSAVTGFGIVDGIESRVTCVASGTIRPGLRLAYGLKLDQIHQQLSDLIEQYTPLALSLERCFVARNVQSAFRLGEVRAMALLAAATHGVEVFEYAPAHVKQAVAAHGRADKAQVKFMVRRALALADAEVLTNDAADALALALCHLRMARFPAPRKNARWPTERAVTPV